MIASENILKYCFLTIYEDGGGINPLFIALALILPFAHSRTLFSFLYRLALTLSNHI